MKKQFLTVSVVMTLLLGLSGRLLAASSLVVFDESSSNGSQRGFYCVDPDDRSISLLTTVDSASGDRLTGFSYRPENGMVYAGSDTGRIWRISPTTGTSALVGHTGLGWIRGLTFSPSDGKLYGLGGGPMICEIDPETAAIRSLGIVADLDAGLACSSDGILYGQKDNPKDIMAIDIDTLASTTIDVLPDPPPLSNFTLTPGGRLFGVNWQLGGIYEFDLSTGAATETARYSRHSNGLIGIFATPEPTTLCLVGFGLSAILARKRRSQRR